MKFAKPTPQNRNEVTLRDYFAGQALAGLCANQEFLTQTIQGAGDTLAEDGISIGDGTFAWAILSGLSFDIADAMLQLREHKE